MAHRFQTFWMARHGGKLFGGDGNDTYYAETPQTKLSNILMLEMTSFSHQLIFHFQIMLKNYI
jgi:hypothetical protein